MQILNRQAISVIIDQSPSSRRRLRGKATFLSAAIRAASAWKLSPYAPQTAQADFTRMFELPQCACGTIF